MDNLVNSQHHSILPQFPPSWRLWQRRQWGYYQLHLLGEVAAGVIPRSVQWDEEAKSKKKESSNIVQEVINARPPLVMTPQGRVQTLPSRFNDLVLDNWKKENSKATTVYPSMGSMKTAGGRCQCEVYSRLCIFGLNDDEDIAVDVSYTSTAIYSEGSIVVEQGVKCKRNRNDKRVVKVFSLYAMLC
nr:histone-lysine N-methyltransferase ATX4-like [Ipomoea batatas]